MTPVKTPAKWGEYRLTFVSALAGFVGLGLLITGFSIAISRYQFASASILTEAQVLSVVHWPGGGRGSSGRTETQVQYRTQDGRVVQGSIVDLGYSNIFKGETIRIRYRPGDPRHPRSEAEIAELGDYFVFGFSALIFLLGGYYAGRIPPD